MGSALDPINDVVIKAADFAERFFVLTVFTKRPALGHGRLIGSSSAQNRRRDGQSCKPQRLLRSKNSRRLEAFAADRALVERNQTFAPQTPDEINRMHNCGEIEVIWASNRQTKVGLIERCDGRTSFSGAGAVSTISMSQPLRIAGIDQREQL